MVTCRDIVWPKEVMARTNFPVIGFTAKELQESLKIWVKIKGLVWAPDVGRFVVLGH